jgi:hypothetical protein
VHILNLGYLFFIQRLAAILQISPPTGALYFCIKHPGAALKAPHGQLPASPTPCTESFFLFMQRCLTRCTDQRQRVHLGLDNRELCNQDEAYEIKISDQPYAIKFSDQAYVKERMLI